MRFSFAFKLFCSAGLVIVLGLLALSLMAHVFSVGTNQTLDDGMKQLADTLGQENDKLFKSVESSQTERFRQDLEGGAKRQVAAAAIYAMQPLQYGEIDIFRRICEKLIEEGEYVALYAVDSDGRYFSGAGRRSAPEVVRRIGLEASNLRVDKVAELLTAEPGQGVMEYKAPIVDLAGVQRGEVRLLTIDDTLKQYTKEMEGAANALRQSIATSIRNQLLDTRTDLSRSWARFRGGMWAAGAAMIALACLVLYFATRYLTRPLNAAVRMANSIRAGNLESRMKATDKGEVGQLIMAMNDMADKVHEREGETKQAIGRLGKVLGQVSMAANEITASASHLANSSQGVTNDAEHQEKLLQAIAGSIRVLGDGMRLSSDNADKAAAFSTRAMESAKKGDQEMGRMNQAMADLANSHSRVASAMKIINEIAFQTNLLALNAAVEAARAGRHGKGFAVVAGEVRNLAAKSSKAAQETERLMAESMERLAYTSECLNSTGQALSDIESVIVEVGGLMQEIAGVSGENVKNVGKVQNNISEVSMAAERNHMSASSAAATAEELLAMAAGLRDMLGGRDEDYESEEGRQRAATRILHMSLQRDANANKNRPLLGGGK